MVVQGFWFSRRMTKSERLTPSSGGAKSSATLFVIEKIPSTEDLLTGIRGGVFSANDEICAENSYWFYLSDAKEMKQHLGIDPILVGGSEDATSPDILLDEPTQPDVLNSIESKKGGSVPNATSVASLRGDSIPKKPVIRIPNLNSAEGNNKGGSEENKSLFLERASLWLFVFFLAIVGSIVGFVWILRSLNM